jgi:hypothetical protein
MSLNRKVLLVLLGLTCTNCHRPSATSANRSDIMQAPCDRLDVRGSAITGLSDIPDYEERVIATLFPKAGDRALRARTTSPQILMAMLKESPKTHEEAVYIQSIGPDSHGRYQYQVVHARAKAFISLAPSKIDADFTQTPIDRETVRALERAWGGMATGARWVDARRSRQGEAWGGTLYTFDYVSNKGLAQGMSDTPDPNTCAGSLVHIADTLITFVHERDVQKRQRVRKKLLKLSRGLSDKLEGTDMDIEVRP